MVILDQRARGDRRSWWSGLWKCTGKNASATAVAAAEAATLGKHVIFHPAFWLCLTYVTAVSSRAKTRFPRQAPARSTEVTAHDEEHTDAHSAPLCIGRRLNYVLRTGDRLRSTAFILQKKQKQHVWLKTRGKWMAAWRGKSMVDQSPFYSFSFCVAVARRSHSAPPLRSGTPPQQQLHFRPQWYKQKRLKCAVWTRVKGRQRKRAISLPCPLSQTQKSSALLAAPACADSEGTQKRTLNKRKMLPIAMHMPAPVVNEKIACVGEAKWQTRPPRVFPASQPASQPSTTTIFAPPIPVFPASQSKTRHCQNLASHQGSVCRPYVCR